MNLPFSTLFWVSAIALGFANPLITVVLIVLYYLYRIIQDGCNTEENLESFDMKSFSDDILEDMK